LRRVCRVDESLTTTGGERTVSVRYEICVAGPWDQSVAAEFPDVDVAVEERSIVLSADLDQAALHGLLERIRVLGIELIEVRRARSSSGKRRPG
jgi:hypothetical protein